MAKRETGKRDSKPSRGGDRDKGKSFGSKKSDRKSSGPRVGKTRGPDKPKEQKSDSDRRSEAPMGKKVFGTKLKWTRQDDKTKERNPKPKRIQAKDDRIRLNKVVANTGLCSRREADKLIEMGLISVNGVVVKELGTKVSVDDRIQHESKVIAQEKMVYLLLNKPKDFITTTSDTHDRKTVMDLVGNACKERIYPVGRLDRATTGLLLFTNDGDLAKKLTHPSYSVKKIYHVQLETNVKIADVRKLMAGVHLEDGVVQADDASHVEGGKKNEIGITLHSGKNRVVRRMMEALGYNVVRLDRVTFAGLTKKDLSRSKYRFLTPEEIVFLKRVK
ncbi:MAG: rRNA pseudouridine synthase [Flavobacteriales bacterium]|nr:rRNA pseudouridine synthase [Flavobacteriales bacterium]